MEAAQLAAGKPADRGPGNALPGAIRKKARNGLHGIFPLLVRILAIDAYCLPKAAADKFKAGQVIGIEGLGQIRYKARALAQFAKAARAAAKVWQPAGDSAAACGHFFPGQQAKQRGLARAIGAGNTPMLALAALPVNIVEYLLAIDENKLHEWLQMPQLKLYQRFFEELLRQKPHVRNKDEEEMLALAGEVCAAPRSIFGMFNNADLHFPTVRDENGNLVEITHGNYTHLMESPSRQVRQETFKGLYATYAAWRNSLAAMLAANVKKDVFAARVRRFDSALQAALFAEDIPATVYDNLIDGVRAHLPLFYRYLELRRRALGVEKLHLYDIYTPLAKARPREIPYQEATEMVLQALRPLGEDYINTAQKAFSEGWVDVAENQGKTSGAYSSGVWSSKPFILLNWQGNLNSVFTLAHELGHSMHSWYSHQNQPYIYGEYEIFVAEVASTVNENLLLRYLLNREQDPAQRLLLVNHYLDDFRGTVFRQTMFAEFEKIIHAAAETGEALSCKYFQDTYYQLNLDYFGPDMEVDQEIDMEWSRIPHFYRAFYVYKYATGMSAATALAQGILSGDAQKVKDYISFLSGGCSQSPLQLLRGAGVDMGAGGRQTLNSAMQVFADMLDELERLLNKMH